MAKNGIGPPDNPVDDEVSIHRDTRKRFTNNTQGRSCPNHSRGHVSGLRIRRG